MRPRFGTAVLLAAALSAPVITIGTNAGLAGTAAIRQPGAGLFDVLESIADGTSPLITEVDNDPFSPFGGEVTDDSGQATLDGVFHFRVNIGEFAWPADVDLDGDPDLDTGLGRVAFEGEPLDVTTLNGAYAPTLADFAPVFASPEGGIPDAFWDQLGVDPDERGPQDLFGRPALVVAPMDGTIPTTGVVDIWGGRLAGKLPPDFACGGQIIELGGAMADTGRPTFDGNAFDLFDDASGAIVARCDNNWYVYGFQLDGLGFSSAPTNTATILFDDLFINITDASEFSNATGYRTFAFRTPATGGYRPDNTLATTYPGMPGLAEATPPYLVGTPFRSDYGPYPFTLDLTLGADSPPDCPGGWSTLLELYVQDGPGDVDDAQLYQFDSGQISLGKLTYRPGEFQLDVEGGGEGYTEGYSLFGPSSTYRYSPGGLDCRYEADFADYTSVASQLAADMPETPTDPVDDAGGSSEGDDGSGTGTESGSGTEEGGETTALDDDELAAIDNDDVAATDSAPSDSTPSDDGTPWSLISIIAGAVALVTGFGVTRSRRTTPDTDTSDPTPATASPNRVATTAPASAGPCDRLRRLHAQARADADAKHTAATEAQAAADAADDAAATARTAATDADQAAQDADREQQRADRNRNRPPQGEEEAWIEDSETGERITGRDLRLRREAAGEAWDDYRDNPSEDSAGQTEQDWQDLDADGAREGRRNADDTDQANRQQALDDANTAKANADTAKTNADQARDEAEQAARDAQTDADTAKAAAEAAEARAATLKRQLDECLGMTGTNAGTPTRWGGPVGLSEDADGGCFPEGNIERRVMETFDRTVMINHWVTVRPTSDAASEARRISGELAWWRDVFATTSSAINVAGAVKGLVTRTTRDAVETAASGASVIAGEELGIDIPTTIYQVPVVVLEGAAAASSAIIKAWGGWIEKNHVEWIAQWGYQVRDCKLAWVEIWKCENGIKKCVERVLEVDIGAPRLTGAVETETYQPREQWQARVDRKTRNHARRVQTDSQTLTSFMQKHTVGPCGG